MAREICRSNVFQSEFARLELNGEHSNCRSANCSSSVSFGFSLRRTNISSTLFSRRRKCLSRVHGEASGTGLPEPENATTGDKVQTLNAEKGYSMATIMETEGNEIRMGDVGQPLTKAEMEEVEDNGSFLRLRQARNWSLGQDAPPTNLNSPALERERAREDRWQKGLLEYEALKRELSLTTAGVGVAVSAYCFLTFSAEVTVSYWIGALASLAYLQLLYRHVDDISEDNVALIFVPRKRKRIGITSADLQASIEKTLRGSSRALSSPRLIIPSALFGLWGLTSHFGESSPIHLQVAPLLVGFFAYKVAALVQAYRDNQDLLFMFPDSKGPEDTQ